MKTRTLLSLTIMTTALAFTACSAKEDETAQLKEQIEHLEQQVQDLQEQASLDPSRNISVPTEDPASGDTATQTPSSDTLSAGDTQHDQQQSTSDISDIAALTTRIQDLEQRVNEITPTGSVQEQWERSNPLEQEIGSIEQELDLLEDELEIQYKSGTLDQTSYHEAEQAIEALEDRLDQCEDQLEFKFKLS